MGILFYFNLLSFFLFLQTQLLDTRAAAFWKEVDFQRELELKKKQIELTKVSEAL